jgi:hypothetical protein
MGSARRLGVALACALAAWMPGATAQPPAGPRAVVAEYDGVIHPVSAEFLDQVIAHADTSGAGSRC